MIDFKKCCISFFILAIIILLIVFGNKSSTQTEYLRLHIRANSNTAIDQNIKYEIKDLVVEYLTPKVSKCYSKSDAKKMLNENLSGINRVIDEFLAQKGFNYSSSVQILSENFPTRVYEDVTLEAGIYDALIINLGSGTGDNWWCVVYPPLCFTDTKNVVYRSLILDIIEKFKNKN